MEKLKFNVDLKEIPVTLTKAGVDKEYILREFDGEKRKEYMKGVFDAVELGVADGKTLEDGGLTVKELKGTGVIAMQSNLVVLCLVEKESGEFVGEETVQSYPTTVIGSLYEACQELNALGKGASESAKNE